MQERNRGMATGITNIVKDGTPEQKFLFFASQERLDDLKALLADSSVDVNVTPDPNKLTALHLCGHHGKLEAVQFLVDHGADVNCLDAAGYTPLISAAGNGHYRIVAALLAKGADLTPRVALGAQKGANAWDVAHRGNSLGHLNASVLLRRAGCDTTADWRPEKEW